MVPVHSALTLCYGACAALGGTGETAGRTHALCPLRLTTREEPHNGASYACRFGSSARRRRGPSQVRPVLSDDGERLGFGLKAYRIVAPRLPR